MNSLPDFDTRYAREYARYDDRTPLERRRGRSGCLHLKALAAAALALLLIWSFFANQTPPTFHSELLLNKGCFLAGLLLTAPGSIWWKVRNDTDSPPTWKNWIVAVMTLSLLLFLSSILWNKSAFLSCCDGGAVGILIASAVLASRSPSS
jgi:hypothetical protein